MWIQIIGATGTGKEHVLNLLQKDGYEYVSSSVDVSKAKSNILKEIMYASARCKAATVAARLMDRKDIVTIRSFYESRDIFLPLSLEQTEISQDDFELFNSAYEHIDDEHFVPPDVVIYCKATQINAMNRAALRGHEINDSVFNSQLKSYEEFVKKIRVPVIELDSLSDPTRVQKNLEFGVSSIKTANLGGRSIWQKSMFWSKDAFKGQ